MTETKFTRGPLHVSDGYWIEDEAQQSLGRTHPHHPRGRDEAKANALLWAAANDLYEACASLEDAWGIFMTAVVHTGGGKWQEMDTEPHIDRIKEALRAAMRAAEKARGEQ